MTGCFTGNAVVFHSLASLANILIAVIKWDNLSLSQKLLLTKIKCHENWALKKQQQKSCAYKIKTRFLTKYSQALWRNFK